MPPRSPKADDLTLFVAHEIERNRDPSGPNRTYESLSEEWGVSKPHLANVVNHLRGVGRDFENKLADAWTGGDVQKLRERASRWRKENPDWLPKAFGERVPSDDTSAPKTYGDLPGAQEALKEVLNDNKLAIEPTPPVWFHAALKMKADRVPPAGRITADLLRLLARLWYFTTDISTRAAVEREYEGEPGPAGLSLPGATSKVQKIHRSSRSPLNK
jgi:hypothetical protein